MLTGKDARLARTEVALEIMGQARELRTNTATREVIMSIYRELIAADTPMKAAPDLVGVPQATAIRNESLCIPSDVVQATSSPILSGPGSLR